MNNNGLTHARPSYPVDSAFFYAVLYCSLRIPRLSFPFRLLRLSTLMIDPLFFFFFSLLVVAGYCELFVVVAFKLRRHTLTLSLYPHKHICRSTCLGQIPHIPAYDELVILSLFYYPSAFLYVFRLDIFVFTQPKNLPSFVPPLCRVKPPC